MPLSAILPMSRSRPQTGALHSQLGKLEKALATPSMRIFIADRNGHTLVSSAIFPLPTDTGVADRDYFQAQAERNAGTYVGAVLQSRVRKERFLRCQSPATRADDGQFNGIIMISVMPKVFTEFLRAACRATPRQFLSGKK